MHFATFDTERFDVDGVIWKVDFVRVNHEAPQPLRERLECES
jgi:hypothetical protein